MCGPVLGRPGSHSLFIFLFIFLFISQRSSVRNLHLRSDSEFKAVADLPLARIKRVMKADEEVKMISSESPILFAKACEVFILELTLRSFCNAQRHHRKNLLKEDVYETIRSTDVLDFLIDVMEEREQGGGGGVEEMDEEG